jgi:hypothetical protein
MFSLIAAHSVSTLVCPLHFGQTGRMTKDYDNILTIRTRVTLLEDMLFPDLRNMELGAPLAVLGEVNTRER